MHPALAPNPRRTGQNSHHRKPPAPSKQSPPSDPTTALASATHPPPRGTSQKPYVTSLREHRHRGEARREKKKAGVTPHLHANPHALPQTHAQPSDHHILITHGGVAPTGNRASGLQARTRNARRGSEMRQGGRHRPGTADLSWDPMKLVGMQRRKRGLP